MYVNGTLMKLGFCQTFNYLFRPKAGEILKISAKHTWNYFLNSFLITWFHTNSSLITSAFAINKIQILFTFTFVRAASVDAFVELIRAAEQIFIQAFINICLK